VTGALIKTRRSDQTSGELMRKVALVAASTAALAMLALNGGQAIAGGGSSATWPSTYPLPTGTMVSQSSTTAVVRSTDTVRTVQRRLDRRYVGRLGCKKRLAVNKPRDYLCHNGATGKTDEIVFTFAALDPTASDPARSQSNAYYSKG
jgi:hypothetical protein